MLKPWLLPSVLFFLSLISILVLKSVAPSLLGRQVLFFFIGAAIFWLTSRISFERWQSIAWWIYGGLIGSLVFTQLVATVTRGTKSWIAVGPFHAQPSQLAVAISALAIGQLIADNKPLSLKKYILLLAVTLAPAVLIFLEPDLGTTVIYLAACGSAFVFAKVPYKFLAATAAVGLITLALGWVFFLKPYQKQRLTSFFDKEEHAQAASYNAIQSVVAVGSGQLTGKGLGQGTQSQLRFLPERQTDFVFASFAEETGFVGGALIIALYTCVIWFCLLLPTAKISPAAQVFSLITGMMFLAQVGVNIGMNIGILPITGITLPFISYGGSSILALSFHLGCLQAIVEELKPGVKRVIR